MNYYTESEWFRIELPQFGGRAVFGGGAGNMDMEREPSDVARQKGDTAESNVG